VLGRDEEITVTTHLVSSGNESRASLNALILASTLRLARIPLQSLDYGKDDASKMLQICIAAHDEPAEIAHQLKVFRSSGSNRSWLAQPQNALTSDGFLIEGQSTHRDSHEVLLGPANQLLDVLENLL